MLVLRKIQSNFDPLYLNTFLVYAPVGELLLSLSGFFILYLRHELPKGLHWSTGMYFRYSLIWVVHK